MLWLLLVVVLMLVAVVRGWSWKMALLPFVLAVVIRILAGVVGVLLFLVPPASWLVVGILLYMVVVGGKKPAGG